MGFDIECILNIQSLPGEYFCPVCRTLVYPNEALQTQCTHLYCKPCLAYTVSTTRACPYDGYLVTEADAKPLLEVNKPVAEAIGKIVVHCLYHRSGCQWQGPLTDCINHCNGCSFGNSPVVCNRCGTQIIHRQVQEHAQNCPGVQPQAQTVESGQVASAAETTQTGSQGGVQDSSSQAAASTAAVAAGQDQGQGNAASQPQSQPQTQSQNQAQTQAQTQPQAQAQVQAQATAQAMTVEQWQQQQQQYQQYYQQYAGYDPYQQYYQQYGQYPQYAQPHPQPPYVQPQPQVQPHPQPQPQAQSQAQVQPQPQPQLQPQPQPQSQPLPQVSQPQSMSQQPPMQPQQPPFHVPAQPQPQMPLQAQPILHPQQPHPQQGQPRPQAAVMHPQNQGAYYPQNLQPMPQQQYPHPQVPHPQMFPPQSHPQPSQTQPRPHMQQPQPQPNALQPQPARPLAQGVTGHQSYPQPQLQQVPAGGPPHPVMHQGLLPQHPVPGQNQGPPQQPHQMLPPHPQGSVQAMRPPQGPHPNAPHPQQHPSVAHHPVHQPSPQVHHHPGMPPPPQQPFPQPQQQPFPHTQQQPFPQPSQARGPVPQVQQPHGSFPMQHQQHVMHLPQQPLRPQGPYPLQQQLQQPVPAHAQYAQPQNAAGRPMMTMNQAVPQQPLAHPAAQNYMPKSSAHTQMSTVQQQQFQLPRPGSQSQLGASMGAPQTDGFSKQGDSSLENSGKATGSADGGIGSTELVSAHMDGSKMTDMSDSKTVEDEKNVHHGDVDNKPDANGVVEISQMHGKEPKFGVQEDDLDDVAVEQTVKDETTGKDGNSQSSNEEDREKDSLQDAQEIAKDNSHSQGAEVGSDSSKTQQDKTESLPTSMQAPLQQHVFPAREMVYPHSGYQDRNLHQLSHQLPGHGPNEHSGMPLADHMQARTHAPTAHAVPLAEQERYPQQPMSYGPPMHQRPPAGPMQFTGLGQERRFQEPSLHQVQPQGQPMSAQLRPQVHNFPESLPPHNQMLRQQPPGSFLPEVPAGGYPGPGSIGRGPAHLAPQGQGHALPPHGAPGARPHGQPFGGPLMGGPPPEAINVPASMMGRAPPPHHPDVQMTGPRPVNLIEGERLVSKRPGFFDGRQPDSHMPMPAERVQFGQPSGILPNAMKMNGGPGKGQVGGTHDAAYSHNLPDERFKPLPEERYVSMAEDGINPLTDERFRPFPLESSRRIIDRREFEEDLKQFPRPAHLDGEGASEFENYLSSRPGFGRDAALRPFDRDSGPISSRLIPPHLSGGTSVHPMDIGERSRPIGPHDDILGRKIDPSLAHLDLLRPEFDRHRIENLRHQRSPGREYLGVPPARLGGFPIGVGSRLDDLDMREGRSFGERSRPHGLPPDLLGNPFRESRFPSFPPSGLEMLPGHLRRGEADIHGNSRFGEHLGPSHLRSGNREDSEFLPGHFRAGEQLGPRGLRDQLRMSEHSGFGGFPGHLRMGDTAGSGSLGSRLRGEMGFGSNFSKKGFPSEVGHHNLGDMDSFEHTRKRKPGSTGWCRICKIDCETVEGLEMHSQTREHQKKAMDIVLSIKKDNAKKQKLSEEHASNEDANKSKQPGSESHGKAH